MAMLKVDVSHLLKEPQGSRTHLDFDSEGVAEGIRMASCAADLLRTDAGILVTASCEIDYLSTCGRCLEPSDDTASVAFAEEFFPVVDSETGARLPLQEEGSPSIDEHQVLDIGEAIRQYAILAQPLKTLCRSDCRGLCPQCGANLNRGSCTCPPVATHPAWEGLRQAWQARSR